MSNVQNFDSQKYKNKTHEHQITSSTDNKDEKCYVMKGQKKNDENGEKLETVTLYSLYTRMVGS